MYKGQIAVDGDAFSLAGNATGPLEKCHHTVDPIGHQRIVLDVGPGHETGIQLGPPLVEDLTVDYVERLPNVVLCHEMIASIFEPPCKLSILFVGERRVKLL